MLTHGHTCRVNGKKWKSPTYQSWSSMNDRCYIETHKWYAGYGGRGIEVCERWRRGQPDAFTHFLEDMGVRPDKTMTLDRVDSDGCYELNNADGTRQCVWSDKSTQRLNQRRMKPAPILSPEAMRDEEFA